MQLPDEKNLGKLAVAICFQRAVVRTVLQIVYIDVPKNALAAAGSKDDRGSRLDEAVQQPPGQQIACEVIHLECRLVPILSRTQSAAEDAGVAGENINVRVVREQLPGKRVDFAELREIRNVELCPEFSGDRLGLAGERPTTTT